MRTRGTVAIAALGWCVLACAEPPPQTESMGARIVAGSGFVLLESGGTHLVLETRGNAPTVRTALVRIPGSWQATLESAAEPRAAADAHSLPAAGDATISHPWAADTLVPRATARDTLALQVTARDAWGVPTDSHLEPSPLPDLDRLAAPAPNSPADLDRLAAPAPSSPADLDRLAAPAPNSPADLDRLAAPAPNSPADLDRRVSPSARVGLVRVVHQQGDTFLVVRDARGGRERPARLGIELTHETARPTTADDRLFPLPEGDVLRMTVDQPGITRLTYADLAAAGFPVADPRSLYLVREGALVPITLTGTADGTFDPGDWIDFYVPRLASRYSDTAVYWLARGWAGAHARMAEVDADPTGLPPVGPLPLEVERRLEGPRTALNVAIRNGPEDNFFFGTSAAVGTTPGLFSGTVAAPGRDAGSPATLEAHLWGYTSDAVSPDHRVQLRVNGTPVGAPIEWDGQTDATATVVVPAGILLETDNALDVITTGDTGAAYDSVYVDALVLRYPHGSDLTGEGDHLVAALGETGAVELRGFSALDDPVALDVRVPDAPVRLTGILANPPVPVVLKGSQPGWHDKGIVRPGGVTLRFAAGAGAQIAVASASGVHTPVALETLHVERTYTGRSHRADWVVIAPAELRPAAERLAEARAAQGLVPMVVDIEDLYRETGFGLATPQAVRDFIRAATTTWASPQPRWFLLLGDGTLDYKGVIPPVSANDNRTLVPVQLYDSVFFETATDNWFAEIAGEDHYPDVYLGRIPAESLDEANRAVDKILAYEAQDYRGDFEERFLLVADNVVDTWEVMFPDFSDTIAATLPPFVQPDKIYLGSASYPDGPTATTGILNAINGGVVAANYFGHGARDVWAEEGIFYGDDATGLSNAQMPAFFTVMNCNNALFQLPNKDGAWRSMGEKVLGADNGGVGFWGSTALVYPEPQMTMGAALWQMLLDPEPITIGEAWAQSKLLLDGRPIADGGNPADVDVIRSWVLLGDPATTLRVNHRPRAAVTAPASGRTGEAVDLDGRGSDDPDPGQSLTYAWAILERPPGSLADVGSADATTTTFVPDRAGTWRVSLVVSDGLYDSAPAEQTIDVQGDDVAAPEPGCACAQVPSRGRPLALAPVVLLAALVALRRFWAA